MKHEAVLTEGSVVGQLFRLTIPMTGGIFAMVVFNLTDTYFVSRLGTVHLAAMSFTFPVVMVIYSLSLGLGLGTSSAISRAIGEQNHHHVQRLATDSLLLTVIMVGAVALVGLFTVNPLFRLLGAGPEVLLLIRQYMILWYSCIAVAILPMVANHAIRATGDTLIPSVIMIISAGLNVILDPIMIFGLFGFPRMELMGAALATVLSRAVSLVAALIILHRHYHMIDLSRPALRDVLRSWGSILHVGMPTALTNMLMPLSNIVIVRLVAHFGTPAVAAFGAGGRVQFFAYVLPIAMGASLVPFIGQNWGAGRLDRVRWGWGWSCVFGILWGLLCFALALFVARPVAHIFSSDPDVVNTMVLYLVIVFFGSGMQHISVHTGFTLNAMGKPISAAAYNVLRIGGLLLPLTLLGSHLYGLKGIFGGIALANILAGIVALVWVGPRRLRGAPAESPVPVPGEE